MVRIFKGLFTKSLLKRRFGTAVPTVDDKIKKRGFLRVFLCALSVGAVRPKPRHKGLFVKSPLESQKLCQNEVVYLARSSLAHLSPKEKEVVKSPLESQKLSQKIKRGIWCEVLWLTFLSRKVRRK